MSSWINRAGVNRARQTFPQWAFDKRKRERILGVYRMHIQRVPVAQIAAHYGISDVAVYLDLKRARQELRIRLQDNILDATLEQIDRRSEIIRELQQTLAQLRTTDVTTFRARAETDILRAMGEQEKAIEELLGMRGGIGFRKEDQKEMEDSSSDRPVVLRIDLRQQETLPEPTNGHVVEGFSVPRLEENGDNGRILPGP
jgi:hypothetical protein